MIIGKNKKYSIGHIESGEEKFYVLEFEGEMLPDQVKLKIDEPGPDGVTTATVTFQL